VKVEVTAKPNLAKSEHLFVILAEPAKELAGAYSKPVEDAIRQAITTSGFSGRSDETITMFVGKPKKVTLVGLGKKEKVSHRAVRAALFAVAKIAKKGRDSQIAVVLPHELPGIGEEKSARLVADLLTQSDYRYDNYITVRDGEKPLPINCTYIVPSSFSDKTTKRISNEAAAISSAVATVRELGNAPPNEATPTRIAERAKEVAKQVGVKCTVFDKAAITKQKMGGLLAVNQGAVEEPRFIILEYTPAKAKKTICLVGKGITFDSGGISIKPAERMDEMKFDMCGAAAVIGTVQAAAMLELPYRIIGLIPSTENLPSGSAYKPGDIITMMSGKTVEIVNTDAEGRVILADALHYAKRYKPDHLIDYATLTGACVVALGYEASGLFSNDRELARKLIASGERVGERLWELPEWDDYKEYIRSDWADMKNSGGRWGGAISAALFLKEFVDCPSWAHLDIAGTAWTEHETSRDAKGATGVGVRATIDFIESLG
jgi:leucyl aminopeptidase